MSAPDNPQLRLAFDFVQYTGNNIFLTGKAGTGKTTFLHNLKKISPKRMVVVAPTGVAAINAGGVTIHSFFQLSFGPQVPGYEESGAAFKRFSKDKINIMKSLDLLVIDEISMVRADMLDGIDQTLRRFKNRRLPFGGVQLLMIGDLQQLAPVVKDDEWQILRQHYTTAFFFSSKALRQTSFISIELQHVYRQSDQSFIALLNKIRENKMDQNVVDVLNTRFKPNFVDRKEGYITLTTHNNKAKEINENQLNRLKTSSRSFHAEVQGNFPEYNFPTDEELLLKVGAQVMFVKNDPNPEKKYYNGKIGKISGFDEDVIKVECPDEDLPIRVIPVEWQNIKYSINPENKEITEEIEGSFMQIPLKLAWAITIHKSQGLTFEKAIIDANAAFAHGQVYVALSRCKSLEGLILSSRINSSSLKSDSSIHNFTRHVEENQPDRSKLETSKRIYQRDLLLDLFDFHSILNQSYNLNNQLIKNAYNLPVKLLDTYQKAINNFKKQVSGVGDKFQPEIRNLFSEKDHVEENTKLQERIIKAVVYFSQQIREIWIDLIEKTEVETDNKEIKKSVEDALTKLYEEVLYKQKCLQACEKGFDLKKYLDAKAKAAIDDKSLKKKKKKEPVHFDKELNRDLYEILKSWRKAKAEEMDWEEYMVMPYKSMRELCEFVPSNKKSLKSITGIGKKKLEYFGDELLELLIQYRKENKMKVLPPEEPESEKKKAKIDTKLLSFELWKKGKSIRQIADERNLKVNTIEGHLAHYVEKGEIDIKQLMDSKTLQAIMKYFEKTDNYALKPAIEAFNNQVGYGDLRLVISHLNYLKSQSG